MTSARIVKGLAKTFLGVGALLLAFVAYQLWGTALYEHSAQNSLKAKLEKTLPHTHATLPAHPTGPAVTSQTPTSHTAPTIPDPSVGSPVGLLSIPSIGVQDAAIVEGTGEGQLQQGPGHYPGTPLPGEAGNAAIAGHRTTYGAPFYSLDALHPGDAINIETPQGLFGYEVVLTKIVAPNDVSVLQSTPLPELTLTTCNPRYSATQRLVVRALLTTSITTGSIHGSGGSSSSTTTPTTSVPRSLADGGNQGSSQSDTDVSGGVFGAVLWGLAAIAAVVGGRFAYRRIPGSRRWLSLLAAPLAVYFVLACFQHVSLALPASF